MYTPQRPHVEKGLSPEGKAGQRRGKKHKLKAYLPVVIGFEGLVTQDFSGTEDTITASECPVFIHI